MATDGQTDWWNGPGHWPTGWLDGVWKCHDCGAKLRDVELIMQHKQDHIGEAATGSVSPSETKGESHDPS